MKKFKKGPKLSVLDRVRAAKRATGLVVKEIKGAKDADSLMNKHTTNGNCRLCGANTKIISSTGTCLNCSLFKDKKLKKRFNNHVVADQCTLCDYVGFVDKDSGLCYNCWVKEGLWKKPRSVS